jgi:superfamily II DNA or RNA helicase
MRGKTDERETLPTTPVLMTYDLTTHTPRAYQTDAFEWSHDRQQAVVCLPTGTGKTLVGCLWACKLINEGEVERILVVEPSRFLVEQTHAYYNEHTTIPTTKVDGTTPPAHRRGAWNDGRVVVTTPQTAINDVAHRAFDAVVIDECHHTVGRHAFAQLLDHATFSYKLGLSATIPPDRECDIENTIGPIRRQSWNELPDEHVPDWIGHIVDTPYPNRYRAVVEELEEARLELDGTSLAGLPSLGIRMLCRDGALALDETLGKNTTMGKILRERIAPVLAECRPLHKLAACRETLATYDFEKAVIFVDRVIVAHRLAEALDEYTTVSLLGRLHSSRKAQEKAVERAQNPGTDIIIATAAGEEGIDLPAADLLVVWSNVVSSVRFIQRLGRVMRPSGTDAPRNAVYLATPDSPDYEALRRGIAEAAKAGLDITHVDDDVILTRSVVGRVQDALTSTPRQRDVLAEMLAQPETKVDRWLRTNVREGDVFYLYSVPDNLDNWRKAAEGLAEWMGVENTTLDEPQSTQSANAIRNNFSPGVEDRYYLREDDINLLETEFPGLVDGDKSNRLKASFGPSHQKRGEYRVSGDVDSVVTSMMQHLSANDDLYATISYQSSYPAVAVQMMYQGSATEPVIETIVHNADAVVTELIERVGE